MRSFVFALCCALLSSCQSTFPSLSEVPSHPASTEHTSPQERDHILEELIEDREEAFEKKSKI